MSCQLFWSAIWTYFLIISSTIDENQSSTSAQGYYSETNDIIAYGVSVFRTIITHGEKDGNLINVLKNIKINNSKIQQLMIQNLSSILNMYSCREESGFNIFDGMMETFNNKYNDFENNLLHQNQEGHKFPTNIVSMYNSDILDVIIPLSSQWKDTTNFTGNQELFGALVDRYDMMIERNCSDFQSLNQYIYNLYNKVLLEMIKVYSIIIYFHSNSPMKYNNVGPTTALKTVIDNFQVQILRISDNALNAMNKISSRYILQRDPLYHKKGITYESLDYFIQGYVADQKFLRQDKMCTPTCSDYNDTIYHNHTEGRLFPQKSICTGRIRFCTNSEVGVIYLAPSDSPRRYERLSNIPSNGKSLKYWGHESVHHGIFSIGRYSRLCSRICSCTCDMVDSLKSIRYVNLQMRESDSHAAFVITGIRFRIINRVLYLQIQEGVLQNGKIIPETVTWKKIDGTDREHDNDTQLFKLDYDNRSFDLTDLTLPDNYVVTMIAFTVIDGIIGLHINGLHVIDGELDVSQGKQSNQSSETISSRPLFQSGGQDVPTSKTINNSKISEPNKFLLKFETSDWKNDAAQNVVPFIDIQNVVTDPPAQIAGIGIHVRYGETSGGFLAPKLISINDAVGIVPEDIKKSIASLGPDVEMSVRPPPTIVDETTPVSQVISTTSQRPHPQSVTTRRQAPHHFIGVQG